MASATQPSLRQLSVSLGIAPGTPITLDTLMPLLSTTDTKKKLALGSAVIVVLGNPEQPIECSDIGQFIDGLIPWMQSSNFKVSDTVQRLNIWKNWNHVGHRNLVVDP
ncbi:hypothetical protein J437_LFUL009097 [Ladona fulva]|uniref:Uncharacterized protein n=1 Tax=Ladona fulva TaxID=123851 RepID=A0A8K0K660_LADFU|nr:hypothetical protein J437_LFUL009097 [Ladona fulva]